MKEIALQSLSINPMTAIGDEWMLITAGTQERGFNTMTASWGHLGAIWGNSSGGSTAVIYIRPQRYTKEFVDREELFTLTFFSEEYRSQLAYLGSHSGRDGDKVAAAGLTPVFGEGYTGFQEARLTLLCRKIYHAPLLPEGFTDPSIIKKNYPARDFHEMYVGQIIKAWGKE